MVNILILPAALPRKTQKSTENQEDQAQPKTKPPPAEYVADYTISRPRALHVSFSFREKTAHIIPYSPAHCAVTASLVCNFSSFLVVSQRLSLGREADDEAGQHQNGEDIQFMCEDVARILHPPRKDPET